MRRRLGLLVVCAFVLAPPAGAQAATVAAGENASCAITGGALNCWGSNTSNGLGRGVTGVPNSTADPGPVAGLGSGVTDVMLSGTGGAGTTGCAVKDGGAFCWGRNNGLYGDGTIDSGLGPAAVQGLGSGVTKIAVSTGRVCAIQNGAMKCWGSNGVGDGTNEDRLTPVVAQYRPNFVDPAVEPPNPVGTPLDSGVTDVAPGWRHMCAIWNGQVLCGVGNTHGAAGFSGEDNFNNASPYFLRPLSTPLPATAVRVVSGTDSSCALLVGGSVWCWGTDSDERLGNGPLGSDDDPTQVVGLDSGVTDIAGNDATYCAIRAGRALCWGDGFNGKLGNGGPTGPGTSSSVPVEAVGLTAVTSVAANNGHVCAMNDGAPWCWGVNGSSQLGNDTGGISNVPVQVRGSTPKPPPAAPATPAPPGGTTPQALRATITPTRGAARLSRTRVATLASILCPAKATAPCRLITPRSVRHRIKGKTFTAKILGAGTIQRGRRASLRAQLTTSARRRLGRTTASIRVPISTVVDGVTRRTTVTAGIRGRR